MKKTIITLLFMAGCLAAQTQSTFQKIYHDPNNSAFEEVHCLIQASDGGYIAGGIASYFFGSNDMLLMKLTAQGDTAWTRVYGGMMNEFPLDAVRAPDSGYVFLCEYSSIPALGIVDLALLKTDSTGNFQWLKTYGSFLADNARMIKAVPSGGYIVAGTIDNAGSDNNMLFLRVDDNGNVLWKKDWGTQGIENAQSVHITADGGFVFSGFSSWAPLDPRVVLCKTDSAGNFVWMKFFQFPGKHFSGHVRSVETNDGGYLVHTTVDTLFGLYSQPVFFKTDSTGNLQWAKKYGQMNAQMFLQRIIQSADGGCIGAGYTNFTDPDLDAVLFKIDSSGAFVWAKTYGGTLMDNILSVDNAPGGGYMCGGSAFSFSNNTGDVYFLKTDNTGNTGCNEINISCPDSVITLQVTSYAASLTVPVVSSGSIVLSPLSSGFIRDTICTSSTGIEDAEENLHGVYLTGNPVPDKILIAGTKASGIIALHTLSGEKLLVQTAIDGTTEVSIRSLANGFYILSYLENNQLKNFKVIKLN